MNKNFIIKTYGCQMNVHDSEKIAGMLSSIGYVETNELKNADVIVFNTCCIRDSAEQKIFAHIGALKKLKKENPNLIVAVCGCLSQQGDKAKVLKQKFPFINIIFGTHNLHKFKDYFEEYSFSNNSISQIWEKSDGIFEDVHTLRSSKNNAWVNISFGCNNFCTYCIVPFVRGRERSRNMQDIINEVASLVQSGYKTITLLGQNVNSYGNDIDDKSITFSNLLQACAKIEGDFKIKFMTSHPKDLTYDVIDVVANNPKISKSIHLPVQAGSNKILKAMNRNYTVEHYLQLIEKIRAKIENVFISTDIIVGFPGETEEDFMDSYKLIEKVRFDGVFAFMYSVRSGTVAEKMQHHLPLAIKRERVNKLLTLSKTIIKEKNLELVGKTINVLVESFDESKKMYVSITDSGKTIKILNEKPIALNTFLDVTISSVTNNSILAIPAAL